MSDDPKDEPQVPEPEPEPEPEPTDTNDEHPSRNAPTYLDRIIETDDKRKPSSPWQNLGKCMSGDEVSGTGKMVPSVGQSGE